MLAKGSQTPFVSVVILFLVFILNEPFIFFVDRVIGQMHILIAFVDLLGVGFWRKPSQSFLVDIDFHRLITGNQHIDSQIELMAVNQQWIGNILADYTSFIDVDIVYVVY